MFTQKWRDRWGLHSDPFACEDADKDLLLSEIGMDAVHSGFDRVFGDPRAPSPGIVFGEKGSGKSGLRLMMRRRLEAHNQAHPEARVFVVESIEFNAAIEALGRARGGQGSDTNSDPRALSEWRISDHLDVILSLTISRLVDRLLDGEERADGLSRKQALDLSLMTALLYRSDQRTRSDALEALSHRLRLELRPAGSGRRLLAILGGMTLILLPHLAPAVEALSALAFLADHTLACYGAGLAILLASGLTGVGLQARARRRAAAAVRSVRVQAPDAAPLARQLASLSRADRGNLVLPEGPDEASRYELLGRLLAILQACGYEGLYVLMDRVDEPTLLADDGQRMQDFVARILDIKLLQHPRLALKLFLPIEMESIWRGASGEQLKRMRLDKSNLLPELKWTGRELYEIANRRLAACAGDADTTPRLSDLFGPDLPMEHVLETLSTLGTPRYAFGFLSEAFQQYVKDLPDDLPDDDPRWRMPRPDFDVVRAIWIDRAGLLRRTLN